MVRPGMYRDRIRIEDFTVVKDDMGGADRTEWKSLGEVNAQILEVPPGAEIFGMQTEVAQGTVKISLRETPGIDLDPKMRFVDVDRDTIYEIVQIIPTRRHEEFVTLCKHGGMKR
jgi:head-tail adaptor